MATFRDIGGAALKEGTSALRAFSSAYGGNSGVLGVAPAIGAAAYKVGKDIYTGMSNPGGLIGKAVRATTPTAHAGMPQDASGLGLTQINSSQYSSPAGPSYPGPQQQKSTGSVAKDYSGRQTSNLEKLRNLELGQIDQAYGTEKKRLNRLIDLTNKQYGTAKQNLGNYQSQIDTERGTQLQGVDNERVAREQESRSALQQVRQLLQDQQRRGQAYLSATGNFGSSIPDAQAEMFSRMANKSLSDVQTRRDQALAQVENKRQQVMDYFSRQALDLQDKIANLEQQHLSQLDAIANAKSQSKLARNQATTEAWKQYVSQRSALENQMMNTEAQWQAWNQEYGQNLGSDIGSFVDSLDQTDQITAPDSLDTTSDTEDLSYGTPTRMVLPAQDEQSLLQQLLQQNALA